MTDILIPSGVPAGFAYELEFFDPKGNLLSREFVKNLVPGEGLDYLANAGFKGGAQVSAWYVALYGGNYTPLATLTAAAFPATATEFVAYAETNRVLWQSGAVASGALTNTLAKAEFTWTATGTAYGGVLTSAQAKGAITGVLGSAVRFPTPKTGDAGSVLRVSAGVAFTSL